MSPRQIRDMLKRCGGDVDAAAQRLGCPRARVARLAQPLATVVETFPCRDCPAPVPVRLVRGQTKTPQLALLCPACLEARVRHIRGHGTEKDTPRWYGHR